MVVADAPLIPAHGNVFAWPLYAAEPVSPAITVNAGRHTREAAPPGDSPGTQSILRI